MEKFNHIATELIRTPYAQRMMNAYPDWFLPRMDPYSNTSLIAGDISGEMLDSVIAIGKLNQYGTVATTDISALGHVYANVIDPTFVFNFTLNPVTGEPDYETPIVEATIGATTYTLTEMPENDSDNLLNPLPVDALDAELLWAAADLPAPTNISGATSTVKGTVFSLELSSYLTVTLTRNGEDIGVQSAGNYSPAKLTLESSNGVKKDLVLIGEETYSFPYAVDPGVYTIDTELLYDPIAIDIDVYGLNSRIFEYYWNYHTEQEPLIMGYVLSEMDQSYLEVFTSPEGGVLNRVNNDEVYMTQEAWVLLDSSSQPHEMKDIAKYRLSPYLYALSNEEDNKIFVYDIFHYQPATFLNNWRPQLIELHGEKFDWRVGEVMRLFTKRVSFMDEDFKRMRLKVTELKGSTVTSEYWLLPDGTTTTIEAESWISMSYRRTPQAEVRWLFTPSTWGTFKFECEVVKRNSNEPQLAAQLVKAIPYKQALSEFTVNVPVGRVIEKIGVNPNNQMIALLDNGDLYEIPIVYDGFVIDHDEYIVYTASSFDTVNVYY